MHLKIKIEEVIQEKLKEAENRKKAEAVEKFKNRRANASISIDFDESKYHDLEDIDL